MNPSSATHDIKTRDSEILKRAKGGLATLPSNFVKSSSTTLLLLSRIFTIRFNFASFDALSVV